MESISVTLIRWISIMSRPWCFVSTMKRLRTSSRRRMTRSICGRFTRIVTCIKPAAGWLAARRQQRAGLMLARKPI